MPRSIRITALLLSVLMLIGLVGCGQKTPEPTQPVTNPTSEPETTAPVTETAPPTEETEPETTAEAEPEPTAEPETTAETEPETSAEPEPEPTEAFQISEVQPIIEDGHYRFNPYLLSKEALRYYDEGFLAFYKDFVTALMNYETECPCASEYYAQDIDRVIQHELPFYSGEDLEFSWITDYDPLAQKLTWTYRVDKDTMQERIARTAEAVQSFLDLVSPGDPEQEKLQTIYHAFCPLMTYDYESAVTRDRIEAWYALVEHTGICVTFADALAEVLAQVDIDATIVNGPAGGESHAWDFININGENYFFDPTFEISNENGSGYLYYGMTLEDRLASGAEVETMGIGRYIFLDPITPETRLNVLE